MFESGVPERTVVIEFDSVEQATAAYQSPAIKPRLRRLAMEPSATSRFSKTFPKLAGVGTSRAGKPRCLPSRLGNGGIVEDRTSVTPSFGSFLSIASPGPTGLRVSGALMGLAVSRGPSSNLSVSVSLLVLRFGVLSE